MKMFDALVFAGICNHLGLKALPQKQSEQSDVATSDSLTTSSSSGIFAFTLLT